MALPFTTDPFGRESEELHRWRQEALEQAGRQAAKYAEEEIKKKTAELRAELAVQQAIVAELARRLANHKLDGQPPARMHGDFACVINGMRVDGPWEVVADPGFTYKFERFAAPQG